MSKIKNWLNHIFNDILRLGKSTKYMEDPTKIRDKIEELNRETPEHPDWIDLKKHFSLVSTIVDRGGVSFTSERGLVLKVFWNSTTGEIKLFPFRKFES